MNTNGNIYTIIYTTVIVVVVAGILAAAASFLKPSQQANIKAETISQMLQAAQFDTQGMNNVQKLDKYAEEIESAFIVDAQGAKVRDLGITRDGIELEDGLKAQNYAIAGKDGYTLGLPVYIFKGGVTLIPCYGAGLWGPVWGYVAFEPDRYTIAGVYFDHESETPGLGAKIKDEPWFREKFAGKTVEWGDTPAFRLEKDAEAGGATNAVDAITGATMTSKGLNEALNVWFAAYEKHMGNAAFFSMLENHAINAEEE